MSSNFEEICTTGKGTISTYQSVADEFMGNYPTGAEIQFKRTMEREGKTLTTYTGGTEFKAFFRINDDNENQKETIVIYYDVNAPVRPGTLVMYGYGVFLALNRESVENDLYFKSTLVKCNGVYNTNDGWVMNIPFYSDNVKSSVSVGNSTITMLNGNIEVLTEDNSYAKRIAINQSFNEFGRTFKVTNLYTIDGIVHIIGEVYANIEPSYTYSVVLDGTTTTTLAVGDTVQLTATPYVSGNITTGATFDWTSSDNTIATVDGTGLVTCVSSGTATITCTWIEHNVSTTTDITIASTGGATIYEMKLSYTTTKIKPMNKKYTVTATLKDGSGNEVADTSYIWSVTSDVEKLVDTYVTWSADGNVLTISLDMDCEDFGEIITVSCMSEFTGHSASVDMEITEIW